MASLMSYKVQAPLVLVVPGLEGSDINNWRGLVEGRIADVQQVSMGDVAQPHRNSWVSRLDAVIRQSNRPVILVAHGLACHAVAWWVALERPIFGGKVAGAVLIAPPNIDTGISDLRLAGFGPTPKGMMPFPLILVADPADPAIDFFHAQMLAKFWGGVCIDAGDVYDRDIADTPGIWSVGLSLVRDIVGADYRQESAWKLRANLGEVPTVPAAIL